MVLMATDLPEPVVPAISRCGMRASSTITAWPRMGVDDLAAHAEIREHAFERGGVLLDRFRAQRGAVAGFRGGQQGERGQLEAAPRPPRGAPRRRPRALACPRGRPVLLVLRLFLPCLVIERGGRRLDPDFRRLCRGPPRGRPEQTPQPCPQAEDSVVDPAERDPVALLLRRIGRLLLWLA